MKRPSPVRRNPSLPCLNLEACEDRLTPAPASLQPDLLLNKVAAVAGGAPAEMVFGPGGRLYVSLANFGSATALSVVSFAVDAAGHLSGQRTEASTGGALGVGFGPVSLGQYGSPGVATVTGMYLTDTARNNAAGFSVSNLRVLTPGTSGVWGDTATGGIDTVVVQNIPAGWHQADQIVTQLNADGSTTLYVGIGVRTKDGATPFPNPANGLDMAYGGTISEIKDLRSVDGTVTDSAGFGLTGDAGTNTAPDMTNAGPYTSTAAGKLVVYSSGARNPFGLGLDGAGHLWFTNNFNRSQADGTFDGTIDPATGRMRGFTPGDPQIPGDTSDPDLKNNVYDQFFETAPRADYGYNNTNWRTNPAATAAGFFDYSHHGVRSTTVDNLHPPPGGFVEYDQSDANNLPGLGPSSSADGFAFYTGTAFAPAYRGDAFITRWNDKVSDSQGNSITYSDVVAVDPGTGAVRRIAAGFQHPLAAVEDGYGGLLVADNGDGSIYRLSAAPRVADAPTKLTATAWNGAVTLGWAASPNAVTYNVYRGTAPGGEGATPIATGVTATGFSDPTVVNGTAYYYRVTGVDGVGEGAPSNEVIATPTAPVVPPTVPPSVPPTVPPTLPPSVPPTVPPVIPPTVPPVVPPAIPPTVPPSVPPAVPPTLPPTVPPTVPPRVPPPPVPATLLVGYRQFAVGSDAGDGTVRFYNPDGTLAGTDTPFPGFTGAVRVATADFNGDGVADVVAGTGPGGPSHVAILDGKDGHVLFALDPFEPAFTGGVYVAAGDITGDGTPDLVVTPDEGGGPRVRVFDGRVGFQQVIDFFGIADPAFRGGARAAVGDVNGDGVGDLIVAAGFAGGPRVAGYDGKSLWTGTPVKIFADFYAFEPTLRNGVYLAVGDVNGDGSADVIAGGGPGGGPRVTVYDGKGLLANQYSLVADFFAGDPVSRGGVRVAVKNLDGDGRADLVVGSGARVTAYPGKDIGPMSTPSPTFEFDPLPNFQGAVFVG